MRGNPCRTSVSPGAALSDVDTQSLQAPLPDVENSVTSGKLVRNSLPLVVVRQLRNALIMTSHEANGGSIEADRTCHPNVAR